MPRMQKRNRKDRPKKTASRKAAEGMTKDAPRNPSGQGGKKKAGTLKDINRIRNRVKSEKLTAEERKKERNRK